MCTILGQKRYLVKSHFESDNKSLQYLLHNNEKDGPSMGFHGLDNDVTFSKIILIHSVLRLKSNFMHVI